MFNHQSLLFLFKPLIFPYKREQLNLNDIKVKNGSTVIGINRSCINSFTN